MSYNTKSGFKFSDPNSHTQAGPSEDKMKSYRDEFKSLLASNRKSFNLPSHNFNICEVIKSKCTREIKLTEIVPVKNVIYTDQMEKLSNMFIIKPIRRGNEIQLIA
jgi:hypothetical protein